MEQELVSGTIAAVVFENPENGYAVIKLDSDDGGLITVVGTIPAPAAGERLIVTGKWTAHATYGCCRTPRQKYVPISPPAPCGASGRKRPKRSSLPSARTV